MKTNPLDRLFTITCAKCQKTAPALEWRERPLQGVPDSFAFSGTSRDAYRMIGNGVPIPIGRWIAENLLRYFAAGVPLVDRSPILTITSS